jgi:hypothetical protein
MKAAGLVLKTVENVRLRVETVLAMEQKHALPALETAEFARATMQSAIIKKNVFL